MKKGKKALVATALFVAAMNLNGCVYGAPPEHDDVDSNNRNQTADVQMEDDASQDGASQDDADASK